ncbi:hypothetical protein L917_21456 [Phytophthora nicotianae]|uniref:RxLR effector protein n=7 Tax=Phytophthora nicotianae TaxID=4792 RepID=W2R7Z9_PHYN3|nr:hypothetical protein PPTG_03613 [Phytophthora nicotianae INRA-310]ETK70731.1 hypothetical protein L915_21944 [Phytophthora nicotianae]ETO69747.1 hypothetical protein F444_13724 [Phytophthora nicotianae P1976]ETL77602.1 hypothetical protein L917_21456 [Phytophthora nicotianae]ETM30657.1 hypothetical protein L914_21666 [Phytophthora nicotianae]ETN20655.1 hypothetical protein PPTG_03613 [Phytophthora nicotianae INRA-310]
MRLSRFLTVVAASLLVTCEAITTSIEFDQAKISKMTSPDSSSQRFMRNLRLADGDNESSEERTLTMEQTKELKALCKQLGFSYKKLLTKPNYAYKIPQEKLQEYHTKLNEFITRNKAQRK